MAKNILDNPNKPKPQDLLNGGLDKYRKRTKDTGFKLQFRGYDLKQVDKFIDTQLSIYDQLEVELNVQLTEMRNYEHWLREVLQKQMAEEAQVEAQKIYDEAQKAAQQLQMASQQSANEIIDEARRQAQQIRNQANELAMAARHEASQLQVNVQQEKEQYRAQANQMLEQTRVQCDR